jgi:hypothetical protein
MILCEENAEFREFQYQAIECIQLILIRFRFFL